MTLHDLERAADVATAMRVTLRRAFLPPDQRQHAHEDRPLPIGNRQTNSQPSTVETMLRLLQVPVGARVLDVGAGSGWTTAILATLVGPTGSVLGVERDPGLAEWGAANLDSWEEWQPSQEVAPAHIILATPGVLGHPIPGGYDRILVSAASRELPQELVDQLAPHGRMVVPVRDVLVVVQRDHENITTEEHGTYAFVPLVRD